MATRVSDGFRHPLGSGIPYTEDNDGDGYYSARDFNAEANFGNGIVYHLGEDWNGECAGLGNCDAGEPIDAISNGYVTQSGDLGPNGLGQYIVIAHELPEPLFINGDYRTEIVSLYAHLLEGSRLVEKGDIVTKGQKIAELGNSGKSTAAHLHFEIRLGQEFKDISGYEDFPDKEGWVDPTDFMIQYRTLGSGPDLIARDLVLNSTNWSDGDAIVADFVIENIGGQDATSTPSRVYLSTNATITTSDIVLGQDNGTGTMSPGEVNSEAANFTLDFASLGLSAGTYYVGVLSDPDNTVAEDNEGNNVSNVVQVSLAGPGNTPPVANVADLTVKPNEWTRLDEVFSFTDADGDSLARLALWDSDGSDSWWADGGRVDASSGYVTESDPDSIWFQGDSNSGEQTLWIAASDGEEYSAWDPFVVTTQEPNNTPPVVGVADQTVGLNEWIRLDDVLSYDDADGDALDALALWDSDGSDSWWADGGRVDASSGYVTESDPDRIWFQGESAPGDQTLWVAGSDGKDYSAWDAFVVTSTNEVV